MDVTLYLAIGLLLACVLYAVPRLITTTVTCLYWLGFLFWSLGIVDFLTTTSLAWSSVIGITLTYQIDGLANLFIILISSIGVLIFIYAHLYTRGNNHKRATLMGLLQFFAISMLGIVITDNLLILFICWELTTISSYLLIQFDLTQKEANQVALNSALITVLGGLIMLVGFIMLKQYTGSWSIQTTISYINTHNDTISLVPLFLLILIGAATKSAQFPFHFWLPGAMAAPTPVSAYLHSATMVNAGVYLLARLHPIASHISIWYPASAILGLSTMTISAVQSILSDDLKALLAYTTLFVLGSMFYLLASNQYLAAEALVTFLLFHGIYKAAAFMIAGSLDKQYGSRSLRALRGVARHHIALGILIVVVFSSMAGLPPFFGFILKEMIFEAKLASPTFSPVVMTLSIVTSSLISAASYKCLYKFYEKPNHKLEAKPFRFGYACPALLAVAIVTSSLYPASLEPILASATNVIVPTGTQAFQSVTTLNTLLLSALTISLGLIFFIAYMLVFRHRQHKETTNFRKLFEGLVNSILAFGNWFTERTQNQHITFHLKFICLSLGLLLNVLVINCVWPIFSVSWFQDIFWITLMLSIFISLLTITLLFARNFIHSIIILSILGLLLSFIFVAQGAPDLAITQLLIEILTVIILVLTLQHTKVDYTYTRPPLLNIVIALAISLPLTLLLLYSTHLPLNEAISKFYLANSVTKAFGYNVVNVILVDFRSLDTLGEAIVILAASLSTWLLIREGIRQRNHIRNSS